MKCTISKRATLHTLMTYAGQHTIAYTVTAASPVPIDITAGWAASPVYTRSPFNSWVRKQQYQSGITGHYTTHAHTLHTAHYTNTRHTTHETHTHKLHTHTWTWIADHLSGDVFLLQEQTESIK